MIKVYLNYNHYRVTVHSEPNCDSIQANHKPGQRYCRINVNTISAELQNFCDKCYPFGSTSETNDMWLEIDFQDGEFEMAVVEFIRRLLSRNYSHFDEAKPTVHCLPSS